MAQHDYDLANASGSSFRGDANSALAAIVSLNSGTSAPSTTFAYMLWADTTNGLLKQRNAANSGWIIRGSLAETRVVSKSSGYTVIDDDFGILFKASGTWSLSLTAAATLADGFMFMIQNTGSGTITIDPNGSEQIDGATSVALTAGQSCTVVCDGSAFWTVGRPVATTAVAMGQCRLTKSGANLLLSPFAGNLLTVNGTNCTVPDAGVTLAATSLSPGTTYYIYATQSGGAINTLEASTTAWAVSTSAGNKGVPIKTSDETRTLVGMARVITGPAWADTEAQRFVVSFWNRRSLPGGSAFTAIRSYASSSWGEVNSEIRSEFLTWSDEAVQVAASGQYTAATAGSTYSQGIGVDGTTLEDGATANNDAAAGQAGSIHPFGLSTAKLLSEGYHYATLLANHSGGSSGTYTGNSAGSARCAVRTLLRG